MKQFTKNICGIDFVPHSPSYFRKGTLEIFYAGIEFGWRLKDGGYMDPLPYASKEAAVMRHITAMENFG